MLLYILPGDFLTALIDESDDPNHFNSDMCITREQDLEQRKLLQRLRKGAHSNLSVSPNSPQDALFDAWPKDDKTIVLAFCFRQKDQQLYCYILETALELTKFYVSIRELSISYTRWFCTQRLDELIAYAAHQLEQSPETFKATLSGSPSNKILSPTLTRHVNQRVPVLTATYANEEELEQDTDSVAKVPHTAKLIKSPPRPKSAPTHSSPQVYATTQQGKFFLPIPSAPRTTTSAASQEQTPLLAPVKKQTPNKSCCTLL